MLESLPTPPVGVAMVLSAASDPDVTGERLAELIGREPSLTAKMLQLANSAAYAAAGPIKTVHQATLRLGIRMVRNIAVSHAVRATTSGLSSGDLDGLAFWEDSLRRATAALVIARRAGYEEPAEAFTVGLVQDLGTLIMAVRWPEHAGALQKAMKLPAEQRLAVEKRLTGLTHPKAFVEVGRAWRFPEDMIEVVQHHHDGTIAVNDRRNQRLIDVCRAADALADVVQTGAAREAIASARAILANLPSREALDLEPLLSEVAVEMDAASQDMRIEIQKQPTYDELMNSANIALIQINDSYEELTGRLQKLLEEKEELMRQLKASNEALARLASTDMLTGVATRRSFTDTMNAMTRNLQPGARLSVLMLDLDHFKKVNDTFGHACGDDVLKATCERITEALRTTDVVGRLGGEEFGVLLPSCGEFDGRVVAERARRAVSRGPIECRDGSLVSVTVSLGGVTATGGGAVPSTDALLHAADMALYRSKQTGRDRATWTVPEP